MEIQLTQEEIDALYNNCLYREFMPDGSIRYQYVDDVLESVVRNIIANRMTPYEEKPIPPKESDGIWMVNREASE